MKVLHVIDSLFVGGAEVLVTELSVLTKRSGGEVELYTLRGGGALEAEARGAGLIVHMGSTGSVYSPFHIIRLARFLRSRRFDIIHVHLYPAQLWVCLASVLSGGKAPVVTTEHSTSNRRRSPIYRALDRWMYGRFTAIAAISRATRDALLKHIDDTKPPIRVVPNGMDAARFQSSPRRRIQTGTKPLVILSVGSLTRVKDQATLIRAIAEIDPIKVLLAGDGPLRAELEELASQLGVGSRVEFLGVRRDIPQLLAKADLYVQASMWEGFCLAVVEAMCGGLPCIVSRNSGLEEVVGEAGFYFEAGNHLELASAIRFLSADPDQRARMSARSEVQARKFTLEACYAAYEIFYRDAIQEYSSRLRAPVLHI